MKKKVKADIQKMLKLKIFINLKNLFIYFLFRSTFFCLSSVHCINDLCYTLFEFFHNNEINLSLLVDYVGLNVRKQKSNATKDFPIEMLHRAYEN